MSTQAGTSGGQQGWADGEAVVLSALPYVLLAAPTAITLLAPLPVRLPAALALTAAAAAWVAWFVTLHPQWARRRRLMGAYYAGLLLLAAGLVAIAPWYGIFALVGYVHAFDYLRGVTRYAGAVATSMVLAVTYLGGLGRIEGPDWWLWLAITVVSSALSVGSLYATELWVRQGDLQQRSLTELHRTNGRLESALAENAALHAQLVRQAREAGVLDERQRMAREIHDTLAQGLAGILTQLQAAEQLLDPPETARRHLTTGMDLARESLSQARRTVHAVQPDLLVEARLPEALDQVTRKWTAVHGIDADLTTTGDPRPMHTEVEAALLRTAQESLTNVAKHAHASRVGLTLSYMEDLVTLDVRDDGVGFDPAAPRPTGSPDGGFGLTGMRQRVQRLAGRLEIESGPGDGTVVSASVPAIPAGGAS